MNVYDNDIIMDWTPREYLLKLKGAQHRIIDEHERIAKAAMAHRYAMNAKRAREKTIFNADKARRLINSSHFNGNIAEIQKEHFMKAKKALSHYQINFTPTPKGGS